MPVDGAGNITRPGSPIPVTGQDADAPQVNVPIDDLYNAANMLAFLDGRKPLRGNMQMNGYRAVGAADAVGQQDYVTLSQLQALLANVERVPIGSLRYLTGTVLPAGYVWANGGELNRSAYPEFWAWIQTSGNLASSQGVKTLGQYGPGNGTTTFTVPNLMVFGGYFLRPTAPAGGPGQPGARLIGTVQEESFLSHTHAASVPSSGPHSHTGTYFSLTGSGYTIQASFPGGGNAGPVGIPSSGAHPHSVNVTAAGGDETRPKNIAYPIIIKT